MKPFLNARLSAKKYGGSPEDYQAIHDFFDQTKACMPDVRHRAILHSAFGIFLCEQMFGTTIENSAGKKVCVRDIGEYHVKQDLGYIPTVEDWLKNIPTHPWMMGQRTKKTIKKISFDAD